MGSQPFYGTDLAIDYTNPYAGIPRSNEYFRATHYGGTYAPAPTERR